MPDKASQVAVGTTDHLSNPQVHHHITINTTSVNSMNASTESRCTIRRNSFKRPPSSWAIDPKRVLFFFATLWVHLHLKSATSHKYHVQELQVLKCNLISPVTDQAWEQYCWYTSLFPRPSSAQMTVLLISKPICSITLSDKESNLRSRVKSDGNVMCCWWKSSISKDRLLVMKIFRGKVQNMEKWEGQKPAYYPLLSLQKWSTAYFSRKIL